MFSFAQENSPFSRYGLGDMYPSQHIALRAMGGVAAAADHGQIVNTVNPASYGSFAYVLLNNTQPKGLITYDIGLSADVRNLRSASPVAKYNSTNLLPSYLALHVPLSSASKIGLVFGFKPVTRINYSIQKVERTSIDSIQTLYEGSGGANQAFAGIGKKWKNVSIGVNTGYEFGKKDINTKIIFLNDSLLYYKSNSATVTNFWGIFVQPGVQFSFNLRDVYNEKEKINEALTLQFGGSAMLKHQLDANQDVNRETFEYNEAGGIFQIDSVYSKTGIPGKIDVPVTYTAGFLLSKNFYNQSIPVLRFSKWSLGADYTLGKWNDYKFYGQADQLNDNWMLRVGGEITPNVLGSKSFWSSATYRAGFYTGKDYINADGNGYNVRAFTLGAGFNLRKFRSYDNQFTLINTAIEFGKRGSDVNNITENFFKFSVGFSLSDIWFIKRKYD